MTVVTDIADLVCQTTGLSTASTERAIVLAAMNYVYKRAVRQSGCYRKALTAAALTSGASSYTIGTSPFTDTDIARIRYLTNTASGQTVTLEEISEADLLRLQESSGSGSPSYYNITYPTIRFWPTPGASESIGGSYEAYPKTLHESTSDATNETTPTAFPAEFRDSILFHGAVARSYEYRNLADSTYHWTQYTQGVAELIEFINQVSGVDGASTIDMPVSYSTWGSYG